MDSLTADRQQEILVKSNDEEGEFPLVQEQIQDENERKVEGEIDLQGNQRVSEVDSDESTAVDANSSRVARDTNNPCISSYKFRTIFNKFFKIPVCKNGCKPRKKTVNFAKGISKAITFDCTK